MTKKRKWDEAKLAVILDRMRIAYDAGDPQHTRSLLDALEIVVTEEIGYDDDKTFELIDMLKKVLDKELETWRPPTRKK